MKVAAGCPFRRVITLFPSMTPGDTTVTFHLSQTPEDRKRDRARERERQIFRENEKREKGKKNEQIKLFEILHACVSFLVCVHAAA